MKCATLEMLRYLSHFTSFWMIYWIVFVFDDKSTRSLNLHKNINTKSKSKLKSTNSSIEEIDLDSLDSDSDDEIDNLECPICYDNKKNACINPCGHTLCLDCCKSLKKDNRSCHMCNGPINSFRKIYI